MLSYMYGYIYTFTVYVYLHALASRDSSDSSPPVPPLRSSGAAYRPATWTVFWEPREKSQWQGVAGISGNLFRPDPTTTASLLATQLREVQCKCCKCMCTCTCTYAVCIQGGYKINLYPPSSYLIVYCQCVVNVHV